MSRVEAGDRLSFVFASWLVMAAALNWISCIEGVSRVVAGNGLGVDCTIWLATAAVSCWIRWFMRQVSCSCNSG